MIWTIGLIAAQIEHPIYMRGINWDKVRRDRNTRKPEYWEKWVEEWQPIEMTTTSVPAISSSTARRYFTDTTPKTAAKIRTRLREFGLRGRSLTDRTNAILRGEENMAWVEFELEIEQLHISGYSPLPPEKRSSEILLHFEKRSATGELEEKRVYTLRKPAKQGISK